jgi:hypothetical protein
MISLRWQDEKDGWGNWEVPKAAEPEKQAPPPVSQPSDPVTLTPDGEFFPFPTAFEEEIAPGLTASEQRASVLDPCQEDVFTNDEIGFQQLEGEEMFGLKKASPPPAPEEEKLVQTAEGQGYVIRIFAVGGGMFKGVLEFSVTKKVERLYGENPSALILALHHLGQQGRTAADLNPAGREASNKEPAVYPK